MHKAILYFNTAFMCVASGKPFHIPIKISVVCVRSAEEIVNSSYSHSEVFTSICDTQIFGVVTEILKN